MTTGKKPRKAAKKTSSFARQLTAEATSSIARRSGISGAMGAITSGRTGGAVCLPIATAPLSLVIPTPPSLNDMFGNNTKGGRGRFPTKLYKDWQLMAGHQIARQSPTRFEKPVVILAQIARVAANADIDNRPKPILDMLKTAGVYKDDRLVTGIAFIWGVRTNASRLLVIPAQSAFDVRFNPYTDSGNVGGWFLLTDQSEDEHGH